MFFDIIYAPLDLYDIQRALLLKYYRNTIDNVDHGFVQYYG